jgi:hypothetical protein
MRYTAAVNVSLQRRPAGEGIQCSIRGPAPRTHNGDMVPFLQAEQEKGPRRAVPLAPGGHRTYTAPAGCPVQILSRGGLR